MPENSAYLRFSPRILDHLGLSAYNSVQKSVAEIVANSYDADATEVFVTLPDAMDKMAVTEIRDNGSGMSAEEVINGSRCFAARIVATPHSRLRLPFVSLRPRSIIKSQ